MKLGQRPARFELKSVEDRPDQGEGAICTVDGMAGVFHNLDGWGDILDDGACSADLEFMCAEGKIRDEHGVTTGRIVAGSVGPTGLEIKGEIYGTAAGKDQRVLLKTKTITRLSIGYLALRREWLDSADAVKAYWETKGYTPDEEDYENLGYYGGARLLTRVRVPEVSTTWYPANTRAVISGVKSGPRDGRTLDSQVSEALAAVAECKSRFEKVASLRAEKGRSLSPERKNAIRQMARQLDALATSLETKANDTTPAAPTAEQLYAQFLSIGIPGL